MRTKKKYSILTNKKFFFFLIHRTSITNSSCTRRRDNCHLLKSMVNKFAIQVTSLRNCHKNSKRTLMLAWIMNKRPFLMQWSQWLRIIWHLSLWHGVQRILVKWLMDTRLTSNNHWEAKFQMLSWISYSRSTMDIEWVEIV